MRNLEIKTYKELEEHLLAFRKSDMKLLILVSGAGLGKTTICNSIFTNNRTINSHITKLALYKALYEVHLNTDTTIIIDEAEILFKSTAIKSMLKILCDTTPIRTIRYESYTPLLYKEGLPTSVTISNKVVMILNELTQTDTQIVAIKDRAHEINFKPNSSEIMEHIIDIYHDVYDAGIIDFMNEFVYSKQMIGRLSIRDYVHAVEYKKAGLSTWRKELLNRWGLSELDNALDTLSKKYTGYGRIGKIHKELVGMGLYNKSSKTFYRLSKKVGI